MTRVLVGQFGPMVRAGFEALFDDPRIEVLHADGDLFARVLEDLPDVVVLDLDRPDDVVLGEWISREFPATTVIACSSLDPTMRVFPRFHRGESYTSEVAAGSLTRAFG